MPELTASASLNRRTVPETRAARLSTLAALNRVISSSLDPEVVLKAIAGAARELMAAHAVAFWIADESARTLTLSAFANDDAGGPEYPARTLAYGQGGVGWVAIHRQTLNVADFHADERCHARDWWRAKGLRSLLAVPIALDGTLLAVLAACGRTPFEIGPDERELLGDFGTQAAVAIRNAKLYAESEAGRRAAETLADLARALSEELEPDEVARRIAESLRQLLRTRSAALFQLEPETGTLTTLAVTGDAALPRGMVFPAGVGVVGLAVRERQAVATANLFTDERVTLTADARRQIAQAGHGAVLSIPLLAHHQVIGALSVGDDLGRRFTPADLRLAQMFADQAALALQNARLYEEAQTRLSRVQRLTELSQLVGSSLDVQRVFEFTTKTVIDLLNVDLARLWVVNEAEGLLRLSAQASRDDNPEPGTAVTQLPLGRGAVGWVVANKMRRHSLDVAADPVHVNGAWFRARGYISQLAVPLVVGDRALGAVSVLTKSPRKFSDEETGLLELFTSKAATALNNARLYRRAAERAERLAALSAVTRLVTSASGLQDVCTEVARAATTLLGARMTHVWVDDPAADTLGIAGWHASEDVPAPAWKGRLTMPKTQGILGAAMQSRAPVHVEDVHADPRFIDKAVAQAAEFHSACAMPLITDDRVLGGLVIFYGEVRTITDEDKDLLRLLADQAAIAIEKSRLYQDGQRALARLQAKNAELDSFAYIVSHDLKTPLVTIQGMAGLLMEELGPAVDGDSRHYLERIQANVNQMEQLIADLLALSRVGRDAPPPESVRLAEIVADVLLELDDLLRRRGVEVTCQVDQTVWGIRTHLQQVVTNLVGNAVKYVGDTPTPKVEIGTRDRGAFVECYVKDNGIGIDPMYHTQVFELFWRLKEVATEGTGVGLAIVKKVVEGAGGRVWVESAKGQGSTFFFTWPKTAGNG